MARPRFHPGLSALAEVALMFLPAIPAYLWLWPAVSGTEAWLPVQVAVYLYLFVGSLLIGLRRWSFGELGVNGKGVGLSLACGLALALGRVIVVLGTDLPLADRLPETARLARDVMFYVGAVGLAEELLFRGVVYRALLDWRGLRSAIVGSAIGFGLYHVGWEGLLGLAGGLLLGIYFAMVRWRAGGIAGLVLVHGAIDVVSSCMTPSLMSGGFTGIHITRPLLIIVGYVLIMGPMILLWKGIPRPRQARAEHGPCR